eukprot:snap_masked-scaffold_59-processed-gene-0.35-mRNA-1 protein AED:0.07 eAED:0.07 QI:0/-1/0/1/-1/1/1/0/471
MATQVLFEAPAGFLLFDVKPKPDMSNITPSLTFNSLLPFESTTDALSATTALIDSSLPKPLKKFLKKKSKKHTLGVADTKLAVEIKDKLGISCDNSDSVNEILRAVRANLEDLVPEEENQNAFQRMKLGLSHSLGRYKVKFSPDKVDTMIVHSIGLLDDLDKEINTYAMRMREWYGWHFPELGKLVSDHIHYAQIVLKVGLRSMYKESGDVIKEIFEDNDVAEEVLRGCELSMGTEISEEDLNSIRALSKQVVSLSEYRGKLAEYLRSRMNAIAPNLTILVGELVGARLIAKAGSLMNLSKMPSSTLQILGAEKALFRALKSKHATPKYGLLYHASLIGQAGVKNKGRMSRVLAGKAALATRVDALGEEESEERVGLVMREKVERRLRIMEEGDPEKRKKLQKEFKSLDREKYKSERSENGKKVVVEEIELGEEIVTKKRKIKEVNGNEVEKKKKKTKKEKKSKKKKKKKE